jgi:quercetin dioxygenase-like cupin family protein
MAGHQIDFASLSWDGWTSGADVPGRVKVAEAEGQRVRLLELGPGFVEPQWCEKGHIGYVISGQYVTELDGATWTMRAGQGFILPTGTRHRSRNAGSMPAIVFIVDLEAQPEPGPAASTADDEALA